MSLTTPLPIFPDFAPGPSLTRAFPIRYPGWSVKEIKKWMNDKQQTVMGRTFATKYWSNPLRSWEFTYEVLFNDPTNQTHGANPYYTGPIPWTDFQILESFFDDMQGGGNQFLFQPPGSVVGGTASITAVSGTGNYFTIYCVNSFLPGLYAVFSGLSGASFLNGQTLQILAATPTYFVVYFVHATYALTTESSVSVFVGQLLSAPDSNNNVELVHMTGGYPILPLSGAPLSTKMVVESVQVIESTSLTVYGGGSNIGGTFSRQPVDTIAPYQGIVLSFGSTPATPIVAAYTFYYPCRMAADDQEYENFMAMLWAASAFKFEQDRL